MARLADNHASYDKEESKAVEEAATGIAQMKLSETQADSSVDSNQVSNSTEVPPGHPPRMKELQLNGRGKRAVAAGKERKGRTLTATLTARSEVRIDALFYVSLVLCWYILVFSTVVPNFDKIASVPIYDFASVCRLLVEALNQRLS